MKTKIFAFFLSLLIASALFADGVMTKIDHSSISQGESFQITFTIQGSYTESAPDFSRLSRDFIVTDTATNSQLTILNGKATSISQWILTLIPNQKGDYVIPSVRFGKFYSDPIKIHVGEGKENYTSGSSQVLLEASVSNPSPYIQSQTIYKVQLFYATSLNNASLTLPQAEDAYILSLGNDKQYQTTYKGTHFRVLERNYAIFPQKTGEIKINPPNFSGLQFTDPKVTFHGTPIHIRAKPITLSVRPLPTAATNVIPAQSLQLQESWSDMQNLKVGDPITRTIIMTGKGVMASQLPEVNLSSNSMLKVYRDKPQLNNALIGSELVAQRRENVSYMATKPGQINIPEIKISWWNTETNSLTQTTLPGKTLVFGGSNNTLQNVAPLTTPSAQTNETNTPQTGNQESNQAWKYIAFSLLLTWLLTILIVAWVWFRTKSPLQKNSVKVDESYALTEKKIKQRIHETCQKNQAEKTRDYLLNWAKLLWPNRPLISLGEIAKQLPECDLKHEMLSLNEMLYSARHTSWNGQAFWLAFEKYHQIQVKNVKKNPGGLSPLYPEEIS